MKFNLVQQSQSSPFNPRRVMFRIADVLSSSLTFLLFGLPFLSILPSLLLIRHLDASQAFSGAYRMVFSPASAGYIKSRTRTFLAFCSPERFACWSLCALMQFGPGASPPPLPFLTIFYVMTPAISHIRPGRNSDFSPASQKVLPSSPPFFPCSRIHYS